MNAQPAVARAGRESGGEGVAIIDEDLDYISFNQNHNGDGLIVAHVDTQRAQPVTHALSASSR